MDEGGARLSPLSMRSHRWKASRFLAWFAERHPCLASVRLQDVDEFLILQGSTRWNRRSVTVAAAASSPALYEVMFSLSLSVPFDDAATPPEMRFAFSQLLELFQGQSSKSEVISEVFWASLHGIAELTRTKRFTHSRQKERVRALVELFTFPRDETAQVVKVR
jgi:hypothetical protein